MIRIGIIGTAGRDRDIDNLSKETYKWMINEVREKINDIKRKHIGHKIVLVSGGSSFSDHIAVELYKRHSNDPKKINGIHLFLPCNFNLENHCFDNSTFGWTLNHYHERFSKICGINSLRDLWKLVSSQNENIIIDVKNGFHERNTEIAKTVDYLIALTFSEKEPQKGGTKDTWDKCPIGEKIHIQIPHKDQK